MENEPKKPGDTTQYQKKSSDAAALSARIVALQGDSDEYRYAEPTPKAASPVVSVRARRRSAINKICGAIFVFLIGAFLGTRLEKRRMHPAVAIVNGEAISVDDLAHDSEITAGRTSLQRLIDDKLSQQYAKKIGVYPDPKDVDARFSEVTRSPDFFQNLKRANETQEDYKHTLLVTMCKQAIVGNGIKVNPSEVKDYYNRNIDRTNKAARFYHPETVQAAVIVSPSKEALETAQKEMAGGMSFAAAVLKYSADKSKARNGVLPPLRRGTINPVKFPGLEKALFDLQIGNTSEITKVGKYYWIIRCVNHNPETIDPFDKVQEACTTGLLLERGLKTNGADIRKKELEFVKASNITISLDQYADLIPKH